MGVSVGTGLGEGGAVVALGASMPRDSMAVALGDRLAGVAVGEEGTSVSSVPSVVVHATR